MYMAFLDGRDVGPTTAPGYIEETEKQMNEIGIGKFASIHGRYYAMDRDKRWERVLLSYNALVDGIGHTAASAKLGIENSYGREVYDEFVIPFVITEEGKPVATVDTNDAIIFFNFRPDRAIQLSTVFTNDQFIGFKKSEKHPKNLSFVSFTHYSADVNALVAFETIDLVNTVGEVIARNGKTQLRIAETEKYPHVTFFMSGGHEQTFPGEKEF